MRKPLIWAGAILLIGVITVVTLTLVLNSPATQVTEASVESTPTQVVPVPVSATTLLDLARLGTWDVAGRAVPPVVSQGYKKSDPREIGGFQETDFIYANGKYYLFATGSQEPAWIDVYVGNTPEELVKGPPAFTHVAPIRYPTVVRDGDTWHIWGVNPTNTVTQKWTEHWTSTNIEPTDFKFSDTIFSDPKTPTMVDLAVRKNPTDGKWYCVGFETWANAPLLMAVASGASGPWTKLNYVPGRKEGGVFGDTGAPPWASASRPDPNIAFTSDGLAWVFFTGKSTIATTGVVWRAGIVQVNVEAGKAIGNSVVLYDPEAHQDLPFVGASDLNLVSVPGQHDRIFAYANDADYPLAILDVPDSATLPFGLTPTDLVRLDTAQGYDPATGLFPDILRTPFAWGDAGLTVDANNGGATGYLSSAYLADLTFKVEFTPKLINAGNFNAVANIGGPISTTVPGITVLIDATTTDSFITAIITGTDKSVTKLNSGISAQPNTRYAVELRRTGSAITLSINGVVAANATSNAKLAGLKSWSLAARQTISQPPFYPFQGIIHSFVVTSRGMDENDPEGQ